MSPAALPLEKEEPKGWTKEEVEDRAIDLLDRVAMSQKGFKERPSQIELAKAVARTLGGFEDQSNLVCEAPTGTGKTLGYLCGAIAASEARNMKIVVSTGTVLLQEQLTTKDLPALLRATALDLRVEIAKGVGRYACLQRLEAATAGSENRALDFGESADGGFFDQAVWPRKPAKGELDLLKIRLSEGRGGDWNGDLDQSNEIAPDLRPVIGATVSS